MLCLCGFSAHAKAQLPRDNENHGVWYCTLIVLSPDADTMYLSSKSTTLTAALCPTSTLLRLMSVGDCMSHTAMERSFKFQTNNVSVILTINDLIHIKARHLTELPKAFHCSLKKKTHFLPLKRFFECFVAKRL